MYRVNSENYELRVQKANGTEEIFWHPTTNRDGKPVSSMTAKNNLIMNMPASCNGYTGINVSKVEIKSLASIMLHVKHK